MVKNPCWWDLWLQSQAGYASLGDKQSLWKDGAKKVIDREIVLLLIGAGIALFSSLITAIVQHFLSLRVDRVKRERDQQAQRAIDTKQSLASGKTLSQLEEEINKITTFLSIGVEEDIHMPNDAADAVTGLDELPKELPKLQLHSHRIRPLNTDDTKEEVKKHSADS